MISGRDRSAASVWLVRYGDDWMRVPFAHPVTRDEVQELLIGCDELQPVDYPQGGSLATH